MRTAAPAFWGRSARRSESLYLLRLNILIADIVGTPYLQPGTMVVANWRKVGGCADGFRIRGFPFCGILNEPAVTILDRPE